MLLRQGIIQSRNIALIDSNKLFSGIADPSIIDQFNKQKVSLHK